MTTSKKKAKKKEKAVADVPATAEEVKVVVTKKLDLDAMTAPELYVLAGERGISLARGLTAREARMVLRKKL